MEVDLETEVAAARSVKGVRGLVGTCATPGDPAVSVMALAVAAGAEGKSEIQRCSEGVEAKAMIGSLRTLGVTIRQTKSGVSVTGGELKSPDKPIDVGSSQVRFGCLAGLISGAGLEAEFTGEAKVEEALNALEEVGVEIADAPSLPLTLGKSKLKATSYRIEEPDPVIKSAFLLSSLSVKGEVCFAQEGAGEGELELLLQAGGVAVEKVKEAGEKDHLVKLVGPSVIQPACHDLPGDASSALFLLGTASILPRSELTLHAVGNDWKSRRVLELLRRMNVTLEIQVARSESKFSIRTVQVKASELRRTKIAGDQTKLFMNEVPFLAIMGAFAAGETIIRDAETLREGADCLALTAENLRRMQARVGEMPDGLVVQGGTRLQGAEVDAGGDARVGMAFALAGLAAEGETTIVNAGPIDEAYPEMFRCLSSVTEEKR